MKSLQLKLYVNVFLLFLLHRNVWAYNEQYKLVLDGTGRTFEGSSSSFFPIIKLRCAVRCAMSNCVAWSWNKVSLECLLFSAFRLDVNVGIPVTSAPAEVQSYLPVSNKKKFIILLPYVTTLTWQTARDTCINLGEDLIHVPNNDDMVGISFWMGNLWMGITRDAAGIGNFRMLNGTIINEADLAWFSTNPDNSSGDQKCVAYFKDAGYDDVPCDARITAWDPQTAVCTHTEI